MAVRDDGSLMIREGAGQAVHAAVDRPPAGDRTPGTCRRDDASEPLPGAAWAMGRGGGRIRDPLEPPPPAGETRGCPDSERCRLASPGVRRQAPPHTRGGRGELPRRMQRSGEGREGWSAGPVCRGRRLRCRDGWSAGGWVIGGTAPGGSTTRPSRSVGRMPPCAAAHFGRRGQGPLPVLGRRLKRSPPVNGTASSVHPSTVAIVRYKNILASSVLQNIGAAGRGCLRTLPHRTRTK